MNLKTAIWTICHLGSSNRGYEHLMSYEVLDNILILVTKASVYSIRATAFYALGLLATTPIGMNINLFLFIYKFIGILFSSI